MARINNTDSYPYDDAITGDDFLVGSDAETGNKTKNYKLSNLADFFSQFIGSVSDSTYVHEQIIPSTSWLVTHNLNKYPSVTIIGTDGIPILTDFEYVSVYQVRVNFSSNQIGKAILN